MEQKKTVTMIQELEGHVAFRDAVVRNNTNQCEIDSLDEKAQGLSERKLELQGHQDQTLEAQGPVKAPTFIQDVESLPAHSCETQCPDCREFVTTETISSVSSFTWLTCVIVAMFGCVAGCCLIPFCIDTFKDVTHKCPKCRSSIHTVKKL